MIALGIAYESVLRLLHPVDIHFREAVPIAALGLCVNLASAWLLGEGHDHAHGNHDHDNHGGAHAAHRQDSNYRAAYVHVLADALTSVLTIAGLSAAWAFGWTFMDPLVGLVGTVVILSWAVSLVRTPALYCSTPFPIRRSRSISANASRSTATGWRTCMFGSLVPATPR